MQNNTHYPNLPQNNLPMKNFTLPSSTALRKYLAFIVLLLTMQSGWAQISETFSGWTAKASYTAALSQSGSGGTWTAVAGAAIVVPGGAASGTGSAGYAQIASNGNYALVAPNIVSGGVGTVTVQARASSASGASFTIDKNVNGGGWTTVLTVSSVTTTGAQYQATVSDASANIQIRVTNTSTTRTLYIHDFVTTLGGPVISISGTLVAVNTTYGSASATPTSFTVSGVNMSAGITVNPPSGYEVSKTVGGASGYAGNGTSITVGASGTIASTTVYVRLAANAAVGSSPYTGNITCASSGATTVNVATVSSSVTAKALTITGLTTGTNKVYDGLTTASIGGTAAYSGIVNGDSSTITGTPSFNFANASVGNTKAITVTGYTAPSTNYSITQPSGFTANITVAPLTITGITGNNKNYDGNTTATITGTAAYSGLQNGETGSVTGTPSFTFNSAAVGNSKPITVAGYTTYSSNYSLTQPSLSANILDVAPGVPTSVSAVGGDGSATVTFTAPAFNGGSAITTYTATSNPAGGSGSVSQAGSGTITVTGLTNGTAYTFTVTATNGASLTSSASTASSPVTPSASSTVPYAPTAVVITPTNGGLSVAFTAGNNGGSPITDYKYSTDNGSTFTSAGVTASPIVITGLTNTSTYQVQIRAVNVNGDGAATSSVSGTPGLVSSAPAITSIGVGNTQLSVNFTAPSSDGGSAITTYQYSTDNGVNYITRQTGTTSSPLVISTLSSDGTTALANGTTYTVLIKAVNGTGVSAASGSATGTPVTAPGAPSIASISAGDTSLTVNFTAGTTGGSALTTYKYSTDGGATFATRAAGTTETPLVISTLSSDGTTALTNGTSYNVQIKAVNAQGDGTATGSTAATPGIAPGAPTITGITAGNGQLSVAFNAPASNGGYAISNYQYSTNGGTSYTAVAPSQTTSPIIITGLTNGTTYTVLIKAVNSIGAGTASNSLSGTPALVNDLCSGAIALTPGAAATAGTLVGATTTSGVTFTSGAGKTDVWYSFTPTCSGTHSISVTYSTGGTSPDVDFVVFATCPSSGTPTEFLVANGSSNPETNSATFTSGTTYYIRVVDYGVTSPTFTISVTPPTPVTQTVTAQSASLVTQTTATLNGNLTAVGVCPATTEKGFVYALTSANSDPLVLGTGVTKTTVATIATGAYTLPLTGLTSGVGYTFKSYVYDGTTYTYGTATTFTTLATAPSVTAAVGATVDAAFSMTFTDNATWRAAITGITVGGTALSTSAYSTTSAGVLIFTPSASILLQSSGSKTIVISATNYNSVSVTQAIAAGVPAALTMTTQPVAPASSGAVLATMPVVTVKDQYANVISGSVVTAAVTSGQGSYWTLGGATQTATTNASGVATFTTLTATNTTSPSAPYSTASLTFTPGTGAGSITSSAFTIKGIAPTITAAPSATVDAAFDATFTDNATWRAAITGITVGGTSLTAGYSAAIAGKITFTPSASNTATLLQSSGSKTIIVTATGYPTATFTQAIGVGAATKLAITTQPAAPASNGATLGTQPIIVIQDQYGNATTSTATILATVGSGTWTIGGTASVPGVSGTATFTNLTATSVALVSNATIIFTSTGLTSVTSATFNIAAPIVDYINITALGTAVTENFDSLSTSATATLPNGFLVSKVTGTPAVATWSDATNISATTQFGGTSGTGVLTSGSGGGTYNFANGVAASATDRTLGFLTSGNYPTSGGGTANTGISILSKVKNTTGSALTSFTVAFDYEKYRNGQNACNWTFYYSLDGTSWTAAAGGNQTFTADADNNITTSAPVTTSKSTTITGLSVTSGSYIYLRWSYASGGTNAQGIGIDNFSITAKATPTITTIPSATYITLGQQLSTSTLSGGVGSVAGTFAFTAPTTVPGVTGTYTAPFTFTPTNTTNYTTATGNVSVTVYNVGQHFVTSFSPAYAGTGDVVTIVGTNFSNITNVTFGGTAAASFTVVSSTVITATVGSGTSGSIVVVKTGMTNVSTAGFIYSTIPTVSRIITDFSGFWDTSTTTNSLVYPNDSHNLLAFSYGGATYSTGVNDSALNTHGVNFAAGNFKALPAVLTGVTSGSSLYIATGSKLDGNTSASIYTHPNIKDLTIQNVLTDGINGLNLGTGYTNLPSSAISNYSISSIIPSKINDNEPDIIVTQIADPTGTATDTYQFVDASGTLVGSALSINLATLPKLGTYYLDLFTVAAGVPFSIAKPTGTTTSGSTRDIRFVGFKLSDFGITSGNYTTIKSLKVTPSGVSDCAFMGYNANAINVPPSIAINTTATNSVVCTSGGGNAFLSVSGTSVSGGSLNYSWQVSIDGGTSWSAVSNGTTYSGATTNGLTITNATATYQYKATVTEVSSGLSSTSTVFTITTIASSALGGTLNPTALTPCLNSTATTGTTLSVAPTGGTGVYSYQWSSSLTSGGTYTPISGAVYSSYSPSLSSVGTIYYKVQINSGCLSSTPTETAVTISGDDIVSVTNGSTCTAGSVTLSAINSSGTASNINWYSASTGGSSLATGSSYSPSISATTTYYVGTTTGSCSSTRQPVTATLGSSITLNSSNFKISYTTTACSGLSSIATIESSNLSDGTYTVTYSISGANTVTSTTATMNLISGVGNFTTSALSNSGTNTITISNIRNNNGCNFVPSSGNTATITVVPSSVAGSISGATSVCTGTNSTTLTLAGNVGNVTKWQSSTVSNFSSNIADIDNATTTLTISNLATTTYYRAVVTNGFCNSASTSIVSIIVNPILTASVSIGASATTICAGTSVTFTATPTNGGTTPTYQWKVNGTDVNGATASTFITTTLVDGDIVTVVMNSNATPCLTGSPATSTGITMTVNPLATASIVNDNNLICPGSDAVFSLTGTSGAVVTYNINTGNNLTTTLTDGAATITVANPTVDQTLTLVSVAYNGCTTTLGGTYTIGFVTTTYSGGSWSNGLPNSFKSVVFNSNYTVLSTDNDFDACSIQVASGVTVIIESGRNVHLNGAITVASGGNFILNNNTNLLQANSSAVNSGNITVKRNSSKIVRLDHTLWSSPVVGQQLFSFSPETLTYRFYKFDTTTNTYWNNNTNPGMFTTTSEFSPTIGYVIRAPNNQTSIPTQSAEWTGTFTGVPNNGTKPFSLIYNVDAANYNLVGNPFPSTIDADAFCTYNASKIDGTIYFYQHTLTLNAAGVFPTGTNYSCWNKSGYALATKSPDGHTDNVIPNGIIQVGQGFFVKAIASGNIDFTNSMRRDDQNHQFLKTTNTTEKHRMWLNLLSDTGSDINQILVGYISGATHGLDSNYDGLLFGNTGSYLYSTINGSPYAIQGRALPFNSSDEVPLGFNCDIAGTFSIKLSNTDGLFSGNQDVFIRDNLTGTDTNIKTAPYTFTSDAGAYENRFKIVYQQALGIPSNTFNENSVIVYKNTDWFHVSTKGIVIKDIMVYDVSGRLIYKLNDVNDTTTVLKGLSQTKQVLFVKVISQENQSVTIKVIN